MCLTPVFQAHTYFQWRVTNSVPNYWHARRWCFAGLGRLAVLDDGLLLQILELLPHRTLGCLAVASRALYCFANHEDLWKALVIEVNGSYPASLTIH